MPIDKKLGLLMKNIQKKYDEALIGFASEAVGRVIPTHSTGSLMLDLVCGSGDRAGFPEGRILEIYGPESAGKTTVCLLAIAARQQEEDQKELADPTYNKKLCIYLDAEHALDLRIAEEYGVNLNELILIDPVTSEDALDVVDELIRSGQIAIMVVDSVPALIPSSVEKASYNQQFMAVLARFMSNVMQKIIGPAHTNGTTIIFINQIREKPGAWSPTGVAETTPGGRALKYYASIRLSVRAGERIKDKSGQVIGHLLKIKNIKNKIDMPYREAEVNLLYGVGVDRVFEVFQVALKADIIKQTGAWFTYTTEDGEIVEYDGLQMRFQGKDKMLDALRDIPDFFHELDNIIRGVEVEADMMTEDEIQLVRDAIKKEEEKEKILDETVIPKRGKAKGATS